ncbi:MAG TPA: hypothetical protein VJ954_09580 [Ignavibacteriaceae bacterium]|nr:hypothetical protein [Ignavibacteriaceae bacterium]
MQTNNLLVLVASLTVILLFSSCKSDSVVNSNSQNDEIKNEVFAKYTFLSTAPFYRQSTILTEYNGSLYRFGTLDPVQVYNLNSKSWTSRALPDSSDARWDGAALNIDGTIYIVAVFNSTGSNSSYDILKYDPSKNKYEHTGVNLPQLFGYPAYCKYNKKIYFFSAVTDSVSQYDVSSNKLIKIAANPFYDGGKYVSNTFSSSVYQNYFYVFNNHNPNRFYRFNLLSNTWEKLSVPVTLQNKIMYGASLGSSMVFLCDSLSTYKYDYNSGVWTVDTSQAPLLNGAFHEFSFCSRDTCLYVSDVSTQSLFKVTLK